MCYCVSYRKYLGFFRLVLNLRLICQLEFQWTLWYCYILQYLLGLKRRKDSEVGSRKSEVESGLNCIVFCSPANVSKFLQTIFYYTKYYLSRASKVINNSNGKVNYRKSELGLPAQQFLVPVFDFRVPGARFSKVPVIIPSPECFTCAVFNI